LEEPFPGATEPGEDKRRQFFEFAGPLFSVAISPVSIKRSARTLAVMRRRREGTISESRISSHVTHEPQRRTAWLGWEDSNLEMSS